MKILATFYKEFLTLFRDPGGMAMIFLMPVVLVTVMSLVEDAPFKSYTQFKFDMICVNDDNDSLGNWVEKALSSSGNFNIISTLQGSKITKNQASELVNQGRYKAMLLIPAGATKKIRSSTARLVQSLLAGFGLSEKPSVQPKDSIDIQLLFDPVTESNLRQALLFATEKIIAGAENKLLMQNFAEKMKEIGGSSAVGIETPDLAALVKVTEQRTSLGFENENMNSVQHNIPAWTMFAMFFIVFPLAGNFIREREDGSLLRLRLIAGSQFNFIAGKLIFYMAICLVQFAMMMAVGLYLMPVLGLSKLHIGQQFLNIFFAAFAVSFAATAYGMLVATAFRTHHQALAFGSVSVVLLAAIGGVWVPVYILPKTMQAISHFSPLSWGLDLCNGIFLRHLTLSALVPEFAILIAFGFCCLCLSFILHSFRNLR